MQLPHAFTIDERYDHIHASDGNSRYGVYLTRLATAFRLDGTRNRQPIADPARFAATAWEIARPPIMDPPFVAAHPRVLDTWTHQDDEQRTAIGIDLAMPTAVAEQSCLGWRWRGWSTDTPHGCYTAPQDNTRPVALSRLTLRVSLEACALPQPRYRADHSPHPDIAKRAVDHVATRLNTALGELLPTWTTGRAA